MKMELAREIVSIFHSDEAAARAEADFITRFRDKDVPENVPEFALADGVNIVDAIAEVGFAKSKGEARRLIEGGGVSLDGRKVTDWKEVVSLAAPVTLKVGKRNFGRLVRR